MVNHSNKGRINRMLITEMGRKEEMDEMMKETTLF